MTVIIYGVSGSTCVRRVAVVCKELNIPYELKIIGFDVLKSDDFMNSKQPFGQMPVVEDDGFTIFESRAIARYLVLKYGKDSGLLPSESDIKALTKFEIAASIEAADFDPFASGIVFEKIFKGYRGLTEDPERVKEYAEKLDVKLQGYERMLSKSKYLAGDTITLADLFHLPYGYMLETATKSDLLQKYPNVARWWNDVVSRPSWQAVKDGA
ncbi:glutathione S-transferase [Exidia glandulosa HHB12029]|uniref:glutathione transferase n=1 Tax=Exidia glandulosa HHB12029 TaxID=1314781 RepID=A0A165MH45_EXIGL|nr:glutathione S-transferase [Exidia glandulosa HHB12029]